MTILSVTRETRAAILQSERQAALSLHRLHLHAVMQVRGTIDAMIHAMRQSVNAEGHVPLAFAHSRAVKDLGTPIQHGMQQFGQNARVVVSGEQRSAALRGTRMAQAQLQASVPKGFGWHFVEANTSLQAQEDRLAALFDSYGADASQAVIDAILSGVLAGNNPAVIAQTIQDVLGQSLSNALTICRTEAMRSLRDATLDNYRANSDVVGGWTWLASIGSACAMCSAMSGDEFSLDEEMVSHQNCKCTMVPNTKSWADILGQVGIDGSDITDTSLEVPDGSEAFAALDDATQRDILGPAKYNAYKAGDITLDDLKGTGYNDVWGGSRYEKSLKELGLDASDYSDN